MKKKNKKRSIDDAIEIVNTLKASVGNLQLKEDDSTVIEVIETSVHKIEKLKKEMIDLKEVLRNKKNDLNQEQEAMWELVRKEKKLLKHC